MITKQDRLAQEQSPDQYSVVRCDLGVHQDYQFCFICRWRESCDARDRWDRAYTWCEWLGLVLGCVVHTLLGGMRGVR